MLKNDRDKILLKIARKFYEEGLTKTEIANEFKISVTHVNRVLQEANEKGIVKISINALRFEDLEIALSEKYSLYEARVINYSEDESYLRLDLGQTAAAYFEEKVRGVKSVGLGSGQTVYQMVSHIKERPRGIEIYPLNVMAQRELKIVSVEANSLVNTLWFKSRPDAKAFKVELFFPYKDVNITIKKVKELFENQLIKEFRDRLKHLDYYFFSLSELRHDSAMVTLSEEIGFDFQKLRSMGIVGDCVFNAIDSEGNEIIFGSDKLTLGLTLADLAQISQQGKGKIVCIAGGLKKVEVLRIVLKKGLIDVLITDREVASLLIS